MPSLRQKAECLLVSVAALDMNVEQENPLYICPATIGGAGVNGCVITKVVIRNGVGAGLPMGASISFGWNTANADNVIANAVVVVTNGTNYQVLFAKDDAVRGLATGTFKLEVQTAEGAALTITCDVFGYLY